ncbi:RcpC/CpaB family pilus assembly protein [Paeniglutamicibacter cryotolerans]|uniref:Flp pilus assembly protein CpaB n=1 Tax=Paeniglutamicibacter cryotolerans TaxID=670079 RepID=A0A839QCK5_9MICC|nr:RcpC/CpaB family pilus assembly protein [Paeniglutamicibacter cryotolerans]MBB2993848.1 Flp pilus assembly protein CpaB [Paeniglutamicibacter cryotolerans]
MNLFRRPSVNTGIRRPPRRSGHELLTVYRRPISALLAAASLACALVVLAPDRPPDAEVLVAAADLPAGRPLSAGDLVSRSVAKALLPADVFGDERAVLGRQLAVPLRAGSALYATLLLGPGLLAGTAPGTAAVPLRLADAQAVPLLGAGQLVDVLLTEGDGVARAPITTVLARGVPVLWTGGTDESGELFSGGESANTLIVVAAAPREAQVLAGAENRGSLSVLLVGAGAATGP